MSFMDGLLENDAQAGEEDPNDPNVIARKVQEQAIAQNQALQSAIAKPAGLPQKVAPKPDNVDSIGSNKDTDTTPSTSTEEKKATSTETTNKTTVSGTEPPQETSTLKKVLPYLLRLVLPAVAGAAVGAHGQIGGLAGGLAGLAGGGSGLAGDLEKDKKIQEAANRFSVTTGQKDRSLDQKDTALGIADYRAKHPGRGGRGGSNPDDLKATPQEQPLETIARSNGGQTIDKKDPKAVDDFIQRLTSLPATSLTPTERKALSKVNPSWWDNVVNGKQAAYADPEKVNSLVDVYNGLLANSPKTKGLLIGNSPMGRQAPSQTPPPASAPSMSIDNAALDAALAKKRAQRK